MAADNPRGVECAGPVTADWAHKNETLGRPGREGFGDLSEEESQDSASAEARRKREATLAARAALVGLELHRIDDGAWCLATPQGLARIAPSLRAAEGLIAGVELVRRELAAPARGVDHA